jgi:hypothetical protein
MARRPRAPTGRLPFEYDTVPDTGGVTSFGGLPLVLDVMRSHGMEASIAKHIQVRERDSQHTGVTIIEDLVMTMAMGGECLDDMRALRENSALARLFGRMVASPETARDFLYRFHDEGLIEKAKAQLPPDEVAYVPEENALLQGLGHVVVDFVHAAAAHGKCTTATLDLDATIQESRKREAKWHYKGGRGYQPTMVVWAEQDLVVADEFRDGNVPAGKDTARVTKKAFDALPASVTRRRFRGDSACYNEAQFEYLYAGAIEFSISADMTEQLKERCAAVAEEEWKLLEERPTERVHVCEVVHFPGWWQKGKPLPRYLAIRLTPTKGKFFTEGRGPKYLAVATNRQGTPEELLKWHWEKAGTIEHVHDVVKNELGGRVLPCGRFGANAAWTRLCLLTYNVLSVLKARALPAGMQDIRPKQLRLHVFCVPAFVSMRARQLWARLVERTHFAMDILLARRKLWLPATACAAA